MIGAGIFGIIAIIVMCFVAFNTEGVYPTLIWWIDLIKGIF